MCADNSSALTVFQSINGTGANRRMKNQAMEEPEIGKLHHKNGSHSIIRRSLGFFFSQPLILSRDLGIFYCTMDLLVNIK